MGTCIIIAPLYRGEEAAWLRPGPEDLLICADGGVDAARRCGLMPNLIVGDFDSLRGTLPREVETIRLPVMKDDTDMVACLKEGRRRGYRDFRLAGALGGRLDHTIANLQCLCDCACRGESAWMADGDNRVTILAPGAYRLPAMPGRKLSLLAWTEEVRGVCLTGALWPLQGAVLSQRYPLGTSNEIVDGMAELRFAQGLLAVVYAKDSAFVQL